MEKPCGKFNSILIKKGDGTLATPILAMLRSTKLDV
jgi:hypothetical protein